MIYEKLLLRGVVPPMKTRHGRRVDVVCVQCGQVRRLLPSVALALRSEVCYECQRRMPNSRKVVICPQCGETRVRMPSRITAMKDGENSLCHRCSMKKGRLIRAQWVAANRPVAEAEKAALLHVANSSSPRWRHTRSNSRRRWCGRVVGADFQRCSGASQAGRVSGSPRRVPTRW